MLKIKIKNKAALELLKNNKINKNKLKILASQTRNGKVRVIKDIENNIIFLEKNLASSNYYKQSYKKEFKKKSFTGRFYGNKIVTPRLDDSKRYFTYIKKFLNKKKILLDFGCGTGDFLKLCKNKVKKLYGLEISQQNIELIKSKYKFIKIFNKIKNLKDKIDLVTFFHSYHYLDQPMLELKNIYKLLNKKGKVIIEVPNSNDLLLSDKFLLHEFRKFTFCKENLIWHNEESLKFVLNKTGFKNIKILFKQRYNINNHLCWILKGKPGGHESMSMMVNSNIIKNRYSNYLIKNKISDTLVAIAEK